MHFDLGRVGSLKNQVQLPFCCTVSLCQKYTVRFPPKGLIDMVEGHTVRCAVIPECLCRESSAFSSRSAPSHWRASHEKLVLDSR